MTPAAIAFLRSSLLLAGSLLPVIALAGEGLLWQSQSALLSSLLILAGLVTLLSAFVLHTHRMNRRLDQALTESHQVAAELRRSEARYRLLAEHANDVIWTMDLYGRFTYISPAIERLRGYSVEEAMAQPFDEALTADSAAMMRKRLTDALEQLHTQHPFPTFRGELEQPCKDGSTIWTEVTVSALRDESGALIGVVGVSRDISERRKAEAQIRHLALHDSLTGLPNRTLFSDRIELALAAAQRDRTRVAVLFIDLDRFKPINDTFGHAIGDQLLKKAAMRMLSRIRSSDTLARVGGDEFLVLLRNVSDAQAAMQVAEKIREVLCQPFLFSQCNLTISSSIGIAIYPDHGSSEAELCRNADIAMYQAKKGGRNAIRMFFEERGI